MAIPGDPREGEEQVFVVRRSDLFPPRLCPPRGVDTSRPANFLDTIARLGFFARRKEAENDPSLKQVIPYGVLEHREAGVFLMRRTREGAEPRLHDLYSLGVGGHVNPPDASCDGALLVQAAFRRELVEELRVGAPYDLRLVGVLNDDTNPVGRVHFGIVYRLHLEAPRVEVRERRQLEGRFVTPRELPAFRDRMESWSRLLVDHLWPDGVPGPVPDNGGPP